MLNPYEPPQTDVLTTNGRRWDRGVVFIAIVLICACVTSIAGFIFPTLQEFIRPRFGWVGLILSMNSLIFIAMWAKAPSRRALISVSFVTCAIGLINAWVLLQSGTVDIVKNSFHDRLHSAWIWSVFSYLLAGGYIALAALRSVDASADQNAV